ncbi:MAG TPA: hypothetical protein VJ867_05935 [Gemmatimonadaceae bacterium]|nr:hypothetical protein [Gemmatimonadaceae bacterium]
MPRTPHTLVLALLAAVACSDRKPAAADSDLTRDLALANQPIATPQFQDTALGAAPEPRHAAPTPKRTPTTRRVATTRQPRPTPTPTRVEPSRPTPQPDEAPAPQPSRARGILAGTSFGLVTKTAVCTTNLPGDKFTATLTSDVHGENGAVIPAGTTVVLEVASVTPGDKPENAQLSLRLRAIVLNDEPLNVDGSVDVVSGLQRHEVPRDRNADRKKVIGGAIAGAVLGQIMGKDTRSTVIGAAAGGAAGAVAAAASKKYDACLPAGGNVRVTTSQPITLGA